MSIPTTQFSPRVAALLKKTQAARGRLLFSLDATASREPMWDLATSLQVAMFEKAAKIGGLDVQLAHFGGDEFQHSSWLSDAHELVSLMRAIRCKSGATQIAKALRHIWIENQRAEGRRGGLHRRRVRGAARRALCRRGGLGRAAVPVSGRRRPGDLSRRATAELSEHPPQKVEQVFRELARLSGGAYGKFDAGAAKQLGELLRAVAAFAVGGVAALANQHTDSARKLLGQMK